MVDKIKKILRKMLSHDKERVQRVIQLIGDGKLAHLDLIKISGLEDRYRVRVGSYRVIFVKHGDGNNEVLAVDRRSDNTYKD